MDDMMKIHLLIDNERYPMTIRREDEQLYRDAAKQIDNKLNKYRSRFPDFSPTRHAPYQEKLKELTKEIEKQISNRE